MDAFATRANGVDISGGVDIDTLNSLIDALKPNNPTSSIRPFGAAAITAARNFKLAI